jgi:hypothetical protein
MSDNSANMLFLSREVKYTANMHIAVKCNVHIYCMQYTLTRMYKAHIYIYTYTYVYEYIYI